MNRIQKTSKNTMKQAWITTRAGIFALGVLIIGGAAFFPGGEVHAAIVLNQSSYTDASTVGTGNAGINGSWGQAGITLPAGDIKTIIFGTSVEWIGQGTGEWVSSDCPVQDWQFNFRNGGNNFFPTTNINCTIQAVPNGYLYTISHSTGVSLSGGTYEFHSGLGFVPPPELLGTSADLWIGNAFGNQSAGSGTSGSISGLADIYLVLCDDLCSPQIGDPLYGILSTFPETASATTTGATIEFETTIKLKQEWIDAAMVPGAGACSNSNYPNAGHCGEFRVFWESIRNIDHPTAAINDELEELLVQGSFWGTTIATTTAEQTFSWGPVELIDGTYAATVKLTSNKGFGAPLDEQQVIFRVGTSRYATGSTLEEVLDGTASSSPSGNVLMDNIITPVIEGIKYKFPWGFYFLVKEEIELEEEGALGNFAITFPEENPYFGGMVLTIVDWNHVGDLLDPGILNAINIAFGTIVWTMWVWWGFNFGRRVMGTMSGTDGGMGDMSHKMN